MSEDLIVNASLDRTELVIPSFGPIPTIRLQVTKIRDGESRLHEAQVVNPVSYSNLEYVYNEGYREAKRHISAIGYQIALTEKTLRAVRSRLIIDEYQGFLKEKGFKDSAGIRDAFLETSEELITAQDRLDMLKAMESLFDGKIKVFENVCRYMKKQMDIVLRSGVDSNHYGR